MSNESIKVITEPTIPYTPTQRRIAERLLDWKPHSLAELATLLDDELASPETVRNHIHFIRTKLKSQNVDLICRSGVYQLVIF